jgi:hypothetical protein
LKNKQVTLPITDANAVLHAMHSALALLGAESLYNRGQIESEISAKVQAAKREVDQLKATLGSLSDKLANVIKA